MTDSTSWHLEDAATIAEKNPYTFYKPSIEAISQLKPGDGAKVIFSFKQNSPTLPCAERMWVLINRIEHDRFFGILDNDPVYISDLKAGDALGFEPKHIIQTSIEDPLPDPTVPYQARCLVTRRVFEGKVPAGHLYREEPASKEDSGWRITAEDESLDILEDPASTAYISLGAVLRNDDSFRDILNCPAPCAFSRSGNGRFEPGRLLPERG